MDPHSRATEVPRSDGNPPPHEDTGLPPTGPLGPQATEVPPQVRTPSGSPETVEGWPRPASGSVGPYELLEEIARGGMGVVYKARHTTMGRVVALKTMRSDALADVQHARRFEREVQAAARLNHPNIVPVYEVGRHQGQPYYAMAYVPGGSLAQYRRRLLNEPRQALALIEKVARAVHHAHEHGVLHRDLKPGNVLVGADGEPHVSDFGLAKFQDAGVELTQSGAVLGTPAYMAPEQAAGRGKEIGPATDVWALGIILYELLTGRRPFDGESSDDLRHQIQLAEPLLPSRVRPGIDRGQEAILLKCLEKEPARRYPSAAALADDLARYLRGEPPRARAAGRVARAWRRVRGHRRWAALAVLAAVITCSLLLVRDHADPDRPLRQLRARMAAGQPATLIPARGNPSWFRWESGRAAMTKSDRGDGTVGLYAYDFTLLELLPQPLPERYLFSAEVSQNDNRGGIQNVGIYFGREACQTAQGRVQRCCEFTISPVSNRKREFLALGARAFGWAAAPAPPAGLLSGLAGLPDVKASPCTVLLALRRCREPEPLPVAKHQIGTRVVKRFVETEDAWHRLVVKVTPEEIEAFFDDARVGLVRSEELEMLARLAPDPIGAAEPARESRPKGGLGILLNRGAALFRNVVVKPLQ